MISVIIPAYNAASTLKHCIESILKSSNGIDDYEIIIVNDGSTDETDSICKAIAQENPQIKYLSKPNEGVSSARNFGLKYAKGEYICFVDSDDMVLPDYLMEISQNADNADITFFGFKKHMVSKDITQDMIPRKVNVVSKKMEIEEELEWLINNPIVNFFGFTWSKVFRASIIKKYDLMFNPDLRIKEDEIFTLKYCCHISSLQVLGIPLYNYNIFETSLSHSNTCIRYDILMNDYYSLAKLYESENLKKKLKDISIAYGLGYMRDLKRGKVLKKDIISKIKDCIIPLLTQGYGWNVARWMPYVVKLVPTSLKADTIYFLLR